MDNERDVELVDIVNIVEGALRAIAEETGESHISAYICNGCFSLDSGLDENGQRKISFFREEKNK